MIQTLSLPTCCAPRSPMATSTLPRVMDRIARAIGRGASEDDDHVRILFDIGRLLAIVAEGTEDDDDGLRERLVAAGVDRGDAWRLVSLVPIAFGRSVLDGMHVPSPPATYLERDQRGRDRRKTLRDQPEYRTAEDHLDDFQERPGFEDLATWSAEVGAVIAAMDAGSKPEDIRLAESVTIAFPG